MPEVLDLRSIHPSLYRAGAKAPVLVRVPDLTVLAIDGVGDPAEPMWNVGPHATEAATILCMVSRT